MMLLNPTIKASAARIAPNFHTRKGGTMRASVEARIRKDRKNADGAAAVYLQVIINSQRITVPLKVSWPVEFFDNRSGVFLPRSKSDTEAQDFNMLVQKEKSKINEIFMFYRHSDFELNAEQFEKEYARYGIKKNFILWAETENQDRYDADMISLQTYKNTKSQLKKLSEWKSEIRFSEINLQLMQSLEAWLRQRKKLKINSAWAILKTVKSMLNRANRQGIAVDMESVGEYRLPSVQGRIIYLNPKEIIQLHNYFFSEEIKPSHLRVLRHFLFSCCTGLRFSDIQRVTWRDIADNFLEFEPYKTRNIEKRVRIPIISRAFDYVEREKGNLFDCIKEQPTNRILKEIAAKCGMRKNLTTHVARHTFATEFLRRGGHIEVLQKLLGHSKIATTMIYAHVDDDRLRDQMNLME